MKTIYFPMQYQIHYLTCGPTEDVFTESYETDIVMSTLHLFRQLIVSVLQDNVDKTGFHA